MLPEPHAGRAFELGSCWRRRSSACRAARGTEDQSGAVGCCKHMFVVQEGLRNGVPVLPSLSMVSDFYVVGSA